VCESAFTAGHRVKQSPSVRLPVVANLMRPVWGRQEDANYAACGADQAPKDQKRQAPTATL